MLDISRREDLRALVVKVEIRMNKFFVVDKK